MKTDEVITENYLMLSRSSSFEISLDLLVFPEFFALLIAGWLVCYRNTEAEGAYLFCIDILRSAI